jgi:hypothetical protein
VADRRAQALRLRQSGVPYTVIAKQLGYSSAAAACKDVIRALDQKVELRAAEGTWQVALEMERLEIMEQRLEALLQKKVVAYSSGGTRSDGEQALETVDHLLRLQERRCRMLGLYPDLRRVTTPPQTEMDRLAALRDRRRRRRTLEPL